MSWVVGRGRESRVWVNVVVKKAPTPPPPPKQKITKLIAKSCKMNETKIFAYIPVLFAFPAVSKANKRVL